jgi:hypothetical protein
MQKHMTPAYMCMCASVCMHRRSHIHTKTPAQVHTERHCAHINPLTYTGAHAYRHTGTLHTLAQTYTSYSQRPPPPQTQRDTFRHICTQTQKDTQGPMLITGAAEHRTPAHVTWNEDLTPTW